MTSAGPAATISGEGLWSIPSLEGALAGWLEGRPTATQRVPMAEEAEAAARYWSPSPEAWGLVERLREAAIGRQVTVQAWDPIMFMLPDEGPALITARLKDVAIEPDQACRPRAFLVLESPDVASEYLNGPRADGSYSFNLGDLCELTILAVQS